MKKIKTLRAQCWAALWPGFQPSTWPSGIAAGSSRPTWRARRARLGRQREHRGGGGNTPDKVAAAGAHPSGGRR
jgi:hypothetical protein